VEYNIESGFFCLQNLASEPQFGASKDIVAKIETITHNQL
jgi:hypothetical protein